MRATGMEGNTVCWGLDLSAVGFLSLTLGELPFLQPLLAQRVTLQHSASPAPL